MDCRLWVKVAVGALQKDERAVGTAKLDWGCLHYKAIEFCQAKEAVHRSEGQGKFDMLRPATWDLLKDQETIA